MAHRRALVALALLAVVAACGDDSSSIPVVRLGYFANVTHAPALIGVSEGFFEEELEGIATLRTATFNAGPDAVTALFSGALDMAFIGPNPAINAYAQSDGAAIRIVAGSTSGGAALVVRPGITTAEDLIGTRLATPQLGNTQDVALRAWLQTQGLTADLEGGGDVSVIPQANAQTLETFRSGDIDGAWVPEPWATRLVLEGGGVVLVDERDLWPDGEFVTTHLIVRTEFLDQHPGLVEAVIRALVRAVDLIDADPDTAMADTNAAIGDITGSPLAEATIAAAWQNLTFTVDPIAHSLYVSAEHATAAGLLEPVDLDGIYDLALLDQVLGELGRTPVEP